MDFLDRPSFAASSPQGEELVKMLVALYPREQPITRLVRATGLPEGEINFGQAGEYIWPEVLQAAAGHRRLRALVERAADEEHNPAAAAFFTRVLAPAPPPDPDHDYYAAAVLPGRRSMIDRAGLRGHLRDLMSPDGSRVLVVSGAQGLGKSHTWLFISYVAERTREFVPYLVDASRRAGAPMTAREVATDIATQLGWEPPPVVDPDAQEPTRVRLLVSWFTGQAAQVRAPVWFVFDGFVDETADQSAQDFVGEVAIAANKLVIPSVRISLLQFGRPLDPEVDVYAAKEPLRRPDRADCTAFFRAAADHYGAPADDEALEALVTALLGADGAGDHLSLFELGARAAQLARDVFGGVG